MAGNKWGTLQAGYDERAKISDTLELVDMEKLRKYKPFRPIGDVYLYRQIWFPIYKDGKPVIKSNGQPLQIPKIVTNFDGEKQTYTDKKCPYQDLMHKMNKHLDSKKQTYESPVFLTNVINRTTQDDLPDSIKPPTKNESKSGFRDIESKHKNPVQVLTLSSSHSFKKVKDTMELNKVKLKTGDVVVKEPSDPKYGYDVQIKYDANAKVKADKFMVQKGDRTPLTDEEKEYLLWNIQAAIDSQIDSEQVAKKEADRLWAEFKKSIDKSDDSEDIPEDLDDEDDIPKKKKKSSSFTDDEDEDEDDKPVKKKKKSRLDDDEEEDDEKPVKKKTKKRLDEDDDEEEEKPKKKKKRKDEDEDDEDDLDELSLDHDD